MKVHVYRNLTKGCWSVKDAKTGKVIDHLNSLKLYGAKFVVQKGGQARVRREKKKYVHAYVSGDTVPNSKAATQECWWANHVGSRVVYNPFINDTFMVGTEPSQGVYDIVSFRNSGKVFAYETALKFPSVEAS